MRPALFSVVFTVLALMLPGRPARADMPAFASYFSGTWSCISQAGSQTAKVFGAQASADSLELLNTYVTATGFADIVIEHYSQHGSTVSVVSQLPNSTVFVGSSPGFAGNNLVFTGFQTTLQGARYQRMTYARTDATHFTRSFEDAPSADAPLALKGSETCVRLTAAPVPAPPGR